MQENELRPDQIPQIYTVVRETWLSRKPSIWSQLVTALTLLGLILLCSLYWSNLADSESWMPANQDQVFAKHQYWRLWTTIFAHSDLGHLMSNSFMFFILGYFLFGYFGAAVFPVWAFALGGLTNAVALLTYGPETHLIGASGVVSWMGGAWLVLYFLLNTQISRTQRALRSFGVALLLFAPAEAFDPHISYRTHFIGFVLGALWGGCYYHVHRRRFRRAEKKEVRID